MYVLIYTSRPIFIEEVSLRNHLLEPESNLFPIAAKAGGVSRGVGERDRPDDLHEEGAWGWGALGAIEAFCKEHFMELVLGWTVVPGDESRRVIRSGCRGCYPALRMVVHILPSCSGYPSFTRASWKICVCDIIRHIQHTLPNVSVVHMIHPLQHLSDDELKLPQYFFHVIAV